jgi:hypothetical protein
MPLNRPLAFSALTACLIVGSLPGCSSNTTPPSQQGTSAQSTLASLKKVDDFPLYTMTYYGDYGFADYLRTGIGPTLSKGEPLHNPDEAWGCTGISASEPDSTRIFGRNFDWHDCVPLLLFTKAPGALASVSMVDLEYFGYSRSNLPDAGGTTSGLLNAPYMPFDGMNEKGVTIGMMAVPEARAPSTAGKVTIGEIQVIRLVLDYAATLEEAISLIDRYNVRIEDPPIHYLIADRSGQSAVIEFVGGQMYVLRSNDRWQVSTNFIIHGSNAPVETPCRRYENAYARLRQAGGIISQASAFSILQLVSQSSTIWSTVYETGALQVHVALARTYSSTRTFSLQAGQ